MKDYFMEGSSGVCEELKASRIWVFLNNSSPSHIWLKTKPSIDSEVLRIVGERIAMHRWIIFSPNSMVYSYAYSNPMV